jgi:hypothetical protein
MMNRCEGYCDFYYDENIREHVCRKCGYVLTKEDKRAALEYANALMRAEEANSND